MVDFFGISPHLRDPWCTFDINKGFNKYTSMDYYAYTFYCEGFSSSYINSLSQIHVSNSSFISLSFVFCFCCLSVCQSKQEWNPPPPLPTYASSQSPVALAGSIGGEGSRSRKWRFLFWPAWTSSAEISPFANLSQLSRKGVTAEEAEEERQ